MGLVGLVNDRVDVGGWCPSVLDFVGDGGKPVEGDDDVGEKREYED